MTEARKFGGTMLDRIQTLNERVEQALRDGTLDELDREVLSVLAAHKGREKAIKAENIAGTLGMGWNENARRKITASVEFMVTVRRLPIGAARSAPAGYFLLLTESDLAMALYPLRGELHALARRIRALTSRKTLAELFGQALLDLSSEAPEPEPPASARRAERAA